MPVHVAYPAAGAGRGLTEEVKSGNVEEANRLRSPLESLMTKNWFQYYCSMSLKPNGVANLHTVSRIWHCTHTSALKIM